MEGSRDEASVVRRSSGGMADGAPRDVCSLVQPDEALYEEWDALALAVGAAPFLRPGWVRAWMAAFSPRRPLRLLVVRRDGDLVALLPVLTGVRGLVVPVNAETPVMEPLAVDDQALAVLVPQLLAHGRRADLRYLPEGSLSRLLVSTAEARGFRTRREVLRQSPYTRVDCDWETFQRSVIPAKRRRNLRSLDQRLSARGRVDYESHDGRQDLPALLSEGFGLELAGWKGRQGTAVLSRPRTEQFYRAVAEWAAQAGVLRLQFLRLDGRAIAFAFQIEQRHAIYGLKKAYDEEFREYGPGFLLSNHLLADACRRPEVRLFEWQGQDEAHKLEFSSGVRRQLRVQLFSRGAAGVMERGLAATVSAVNVEARRRLSSERRQQIRRALHRVSAAAPDLAAARRGKGRG